MADKSCDLSHTENKIKEQMKKITIIFTQNGEQLPFGVKTIFFSAWDKSRDLSVYIQLIAQM